MAKQNYDTSEGRWVTIAGRRVFIKYEQTLDKAMIESGKFTEERNNNSFNTLKESFDLVFEKIEKDGTIEKQTIYSLFKKEKYFIGVWEDGEDVYFTREVINNIINKHILKDYNSVSNKRNLWKEDIEELKHILKYDYKFKDEKNPSSNNINFFTKSKKRDGYYDCIIEENENGYKMFHYMYLSNKKANKEMKKKEQKGLKIE